MWVILCVYFVLASMLSTNLIRSYINLELSAEMSYKELHVVDKYNQKCDRLVPNPWIGLWLALLFIYFSIKYIWVEPDLRMVAFTFMVCFYYIVNIMMLLDAKKAARRHQILVMRNHYLQTQVDELTDHITEIKMFS